MKGKISVYGVLLVDYLGNFQEIVNFLIPDKQREAAGLQTAVTCDRGGLYWTVQAFSCRYRDSKDILVSLDRHNIRISLKCN